MGKTILRRFLILIPQIIFITLFIFILAEFMPGDAFGHLAEDAEGAALAATLAEAHGLNLPWHVRYYRWISGIVTNLDFGRSIQHARPVMEIVGERMINTLRLSGLTVLITYLIAIPFGIWAGRHKEKFVDKAILFYAFTALAMPTIVLSIVVIFAFGFQLQWIPIRGSVDIQAVPGTFGYFMSRMHHLIGPAITGALLSTVSIIFFLRNEIVDVQASDFVTTARSKGVPKSDVYRKHILRNAMLPIVPSIGTTIGALFAGSIFIERVFSYPGIGTLFIDSILQRDFPVVNTLVLLTSIITALGVLISDILLTVVDPRIRIK